MSFSRQQALDCFADDDLIGIGMEADAVRRSLNPEGVVTYAIETLLKLSPGAEVPDDPSLLTALAAALDCDASAILLRPSPAHDLSAHERILRILIQRAPRLCLKLSTDTIDALARPAAIPISNILRRLQQAGLGALTGNASGTALGIHRAAHALGIPTFASLAFGSDESSEGIASALDAIRTLQQESTGFLSFILHAAPAPSGRDLDEPTAVEYLRTLAIARMILDNIPHIEADPGQGLKVLQVGLRFGADSIGPLQPPATPEEEIRRLIRDAGFKPVQCDALYRTHFLL